MYGLCDPYPEWWWLLQNISNSSFKQHNWTKRCWSLFPSEFPKRKKAYSKKCQNIFNYFNGQLFKMDYTLLCLVEQNILIRLNLFLMAPFHHLEHRLLDCAKILWLYSGAWIMHNSMQSLSSPSCYTFQFFCLLFVIFCFILSHSDPPISAPMAEFHFLMLNYVV